MQCKWTQRDILHAFHFVFLYLYSKQFPTGIFEEEKCHQHDVDSLRLSSIRLFFGLVIVSASLGCMSAFLKGFFCAIAKVERDVGFQSWSK